MPSKSFIEILEDQIRQDLRSEIRREIEQEMKNANKPHDESVSDSRTAASMSGRVESWLAANIGKTVFGRPQQARQAYRTGAPRKETRPTEPPPPQEPPKEPTFTPRCVEELMAVEIIRRQSGVKLASSFTENELKSAWRRAALKTHPDLCSQADALTQAKAHAHFQELVAAYDRLQAAFIGRAAA
jgi:hypothetical protein